jgi:hypothetical protein
MGRHFTQAADLFSVPVDLVYVVDMGYVESEAERGVCRGIDVDVAPVPGIAGVVEVPLHSPGFIDLNALPC